MTIAYIQSNLVRRTLTVLIVLFFPILVPLQAIAAFWQGGWKEATWRIWAEFTQAGDGFWKSVRDCWIAPQQRSPDDDALPYE